MMNQRPADDDPPVTPPMWRRYLRMIRPNHPADLDDELRDHIESTTEALIARGMAPDAARAEALRRFGDVGRVRTEVQQLDSTHEKHINRSASLETVWYDIRHAARGLRRSPALTIVAAISIALGVAANTTVFSVVNAILLRPIPGAHASRLERVYVNHHSPFDWRDLTWFREHAKSFSYFVGERYGMMSFRSAATAEAERIHTSYVTGAFFAALGAHVALGRSFDVDETKRIGDEPVGVITYRFWQRRFAGDSSVIGRQVVLSDHLFTIVGVADRDFRSSVMGWSPDVFLPFAMAPVLTGQRLEDFGGSFYTTAQLRAGVSADQAQTELRSLMTQLARTDSERYDGVTVRLGDIRGVSAEARAGVAAGSAFLMAMVAMVLLIACANVANLLLGRAAARRTEMGVRLAIGASRQRLVRQLLTESLLLAVIGTIAGFTVSWIITGILPLALPPEAGIDSDYFAPDGRVALFTAALCLVTTLLFGAVPAFRAASPNLAGMIKGDAVPSKRRERRGRLVVLQTAMCVLLLAVASLFLRGLATARGVDPGFRADGVIDVAIDLGLLPRGVDRSQLFSNLRRDAMTLPGVRSASLAAVVPLGGSNMETSILPEGVTTKSRREQLPVYFNVVSPRFFETLRTPIVRGREFLDGDREGAPRVAVINESGARRLWPNRDALGNRFSFGGGDTSFVQIVGIVRDASYVMPGEAPKSTIYYPFAQQPRAEMTLQLRTTSGLATTRRAVWRLVHSAAPELPPPPVVHMTDDMSITLLPVRAGALLLGTFGFIALVLAAAGIYGVAAYSVASRKREIGVRAALGATRSRLLRMVLMENAERVAIGAVIGLAATVAVGAGLSRVLFGVRAVDPAVLLGVSGVIALVGFVATLAPARRAANADPVSAMRAE